MLGERLCEHDAIFVPRDAARHDSWRSGDVCDHDGRKNVGQSYSKDTYTLYLSTIYLLYISIYLFVN